MQDDKVVVVIKSDSSEFPTIAHDRQLRIAEEKESIYLMVLPVLRRIHWGIGRFCL
jgi:hypothetical protein